MTVIRITSYNVCYTKLLREGYLTEQVTQAAHRLGIAVLVFDCRQRITTVDLGKGYTIFLVWLVYGPCTQRRSYHTSYNFV